MLTAGIPQLRTTCAEKDTLHPSKRLAKVFNQNLIMRNQSDRSPLSNILRDIQPEQFKNGNVMHEHKEGRGNIRDYRGLERHDNKMQSLTLEWMPSQEKTDKGHLEGQLGKSE